MKNKITTILFSIVLFMGLIFSIILKDKDISVSERRHLASFPSPTFNKVIDGSYFTSLDNYILDHFPLRDNFRNIKALTNKYLFASTDNNNIFIKDNYIFEMNYKLNEQAINNYIKNVNNFIDINSTNNNIYYSIIPDKNYYLNDTHLKLDYDLMINKLSKINTKYIDITSSLSLKDYYKTDIHWRQENLKEVLNTLGKALNQNFTFNYKENNYNNFTGALYSKAALNIEKDTLTYLTNDIVDNVKVTHYEKNKGNTIYKKDELNKIDSYNIFLSGPTSLVTLNNNKQNNNRELIIFRDSFTSSLAPLLIENYSKITLIDLRYISMSVIKEIINFNNKDIIFLYNTSIINNSSILKFN
ncbi:MAG: DHHW family protein [Bacilli bacterium]